MDITIYTTTTCAFCGTVKKFLDSKKIPYKVVNVDNDPKKRQELLQRTGATTVPITEIHTPQKVDDGYFIDYIVGWNPTKFSELAKEYVVG